MKIPIKINTKHKWLLTIGTIIAVLFVLGIVTFFKDHDAHYITVPVIQGNIVKSITTNGTLTPKNRVEVNSRITGTLKKLYVKLGQRVKRGQLLAKIDSTLEQHYLSQSQSGLAKTLAQEHGQQIELRRAQKILSREQEMVKSEATSQAALENAEFNVLIARSNLEAIKSQTNLERSHVKEVQTKLSYTFIRAPMDGTVTQIVTKEGEHVVVSVDAPIILRLAQLDTMTLRASISEVDIIRIKRGQKAYFSILGLPNHHFQAIVGDIEQNPNNSNEGSDRAVFYSIYFDAPNPKSIFRVGMTAQVSIVLKEAKNTLLIPASVLESQNVDGRYVVKVLDSEGKIQQRLVRIGINNNSMAQVLSGLKLNEKVIVGIKQSEDEAIDHETSNPQKKRKSIARFL